MPFEINQEYATSSVCDHECIFKVTKRTAKSVWITGDTHESQPVRRKIEMWEGKESIYPLGHYSMAAIIREDDLI